jgi:hypothetical protein
MRERGAGCCCWCWCWRGRCWTCLAAHADRPPQEAPRTSTVAPPLRDAPSSSPDPNLAEEEESFLPLAEMTWASALATVITGGVRFLGGGLGVGAGGSSRRDSTSALLVGICRVGRRARRDETLGRRSEGLRSEVRMPSCHSRGNTFATGASRPYYCHCPHLSQVLPLSSDPIASSEPSSLESS